jgi:hypothetical protein
MTLTPCVVTYVALTLQREHIEVSVAAFVTCPVVGVHFIATLKPDLFTAVTQQAVITLTRTQKTQPNVFSTLILLVPRRCALNFYRCEMSVSCCRHVYNSSHRAVSCIQRERMRLIYLHVRLRTCSSSGSLVPERPFDARRGLIFARRIFGAHYPPLQRVPE